MLTPDQVTVQRTGIASDALVDPAARKIYFAENVDVVRGDTAVFRDLVRRINEPVDYWLGAGKVATFEEGPHFLPDLGRILRGVRWTTNYTTGDRILAAGDEIWSGPCNIESDPYAFDSRTDIAGQFVGTAVFLIQLPLEVIDIKDGDTFQITSSRDGRLLVRVLTIKSARANSDKLYREVLAFDNQGD